MEKFQDLTTNFESGVEDRLTWRKTSVADGIPKRVECGADNGTGLLVAPHGKTDYWQRTYYEPLMVNSNGSILGVDVTCPTKLVAETSLTLDVKSQFDQAGLMVYVDDYHWLKTGLEFSDGKIYLGTVVTNGFSDWSTQDWGSTKLSIRLYVLPNDSCAVEAKADDGTWKMIRLAHLEMGQKPAKVGLFTCAPTAEGTSTVFHSLSIKATEGFWHHS